MTSYQRAIETAVCHRNGCDLTATDGAYCDEHAEAQREYARRHIQQVRELRRENGYCATCPKGVFTVSATYRCAACERKRKPSTEMLPISTPSTIDS